MPVLTRYRTLCRRAARQILPAAQQAMAYARYARYHSFFSQRRAHGAPSCWQRSRHRVSAACYSESHSTRCSRRVSDTRCCRLRHISTARHEPSTFVQRLDTMRQGLSPVTPAALCTVVLAASAEDVENTRRPLNRARSRASAACCSATRPSPAEMIMAIARGALLHVFPFTGRRVVAQYGR